MPLETLQDRLEGTEPHYESIRAVCPLCGQPQVYIQSNGDRLRLTWFWNLCSCQPTDIHRMLGIEACILPHGLAESCRSFVGRLVYVNPVYGWGWSRADIEDPEAALHTFGKERACPVPFHLRIHFFYEFQGKLKGTVGVIEEPGHLLDGFWAEFYPRVRGLWDFAEHLTHYNIHIGPNKPVLPEPDSKERASWSKFDFTGSPVWWGYCNGIGASREIVERYQGCWKQS